MAEIKLETRLVGDIKGAFYVPDYQRGYRWGAPEVEALLNDIYEYGRSDKGASNGNYCLQPIVVRNLGDQYELIDGQQRLTTLYLIYVYMHEKSNGFLSEPRFTLSYETREQSAEFLKHPDESIKDTNIDFFFIYEAYKTIRNWFGAFEATGKLQSALTNINKFFDESVKIIWYEVPDTEKSIDLFTRLNIGKIPLTSSELVKALFLKDENKNLIRQEELSLEWDNMERALHDNALWGFLSNVEPENYPTRIDLVLDLISGKKQGDKERYQTFLYFDAELKKGKSLVDIWDEIQHTFLTLKEWFNSHEFYHKTGYLIASGSKTLSKLLNDYQGKSKTEFREYLNQSIRKSIAFSKPYDELDYEHNKEEIHKILLLFNVESVRNIDAHKRRFPFDRHKKEKWSLEHIHARHSQGLQTNDKIKEWLEAHIQSLRSIGQQESLINAMQTLLQTIAENPKTARVTSEFEQLQPLVVEALSPQGEDTEYIHLLSNMALLSVPQNSAINNYTFDAKRNIIIEMDKKGKYIPFCTKMVFLKYYSSRETNLHFWSQTDRTTYRKAMDEVLAPYLPDNSKETE